MSLAILVGAELNAQLEGLRDELEPDPSVWLATRSRSPRARMPTCSSRRRGCACGRAETSKNDLERGTLQPCAKVWSRTPC